MFLVEHNYRFNLTDIKGVLIIANTNVKRKELAKHTDQSQESISTVVSSNEVKHNKESDSNKK